MKTSGNPVITTRNLTKTFGGLEVLRGVDLTVPEHSIYGFLGPNGAGKTTLMKILLGQIRPTSGSGSIFGLDVARESLEIRRMIGYLPQQPKFIDYLTARENLHFTAKFFFSGPEGKIRERCQEMLELVDLEDKADRPIHGFSGGEKQRLGLALAQVNYPDLLILDEPASALDPLGRQDVMNIMERLRKHTTIFFSTHILDDVQRVSDRVAILNRGQIVASGPIAEILAGQKDAVYSLVLEGSKPGLEGKLVKLPWVKQVQSTSTPGSTRMEITVTDKRLAQTGLLRGLLKDPELIVTEFSQKKYELEDVFVEIITGGGHGGK